MAAAGFGFLLYEYDLGKYLFIPDNYSSGSQEASSFADYLLLIDKFFSKAIEIKKAYYGGGTNLYKEFLELKQSMLVNKLSEVQMNFILSATNLPVIDNQPSEHIKESVQNTHQSNTDVLIAAHYQNSVTTKSALKQACDKKSLLKVAFTI